MHVTWVENMEVSTLGLAQDDLFWTVVNADLLSVQGNGLVHCHKGYSNYYTSTSIDNHI